ncbi:MAG: DUF1109 domain-containing protein [Alphaproteobacteria bacterium]|nr:DUF1109 domain-containing protein [Alphaproteobacteria bacterium]
MTQGTDDLIRRLAHSGAQVRPLASPSRRTLFWLAVSLPYVAAIVLLMSPRPGLIEKLSELRFQVEQLAALATAVSAAMASFCAIVPGRPRWPLLIPLLPLAVWLGSLGQGCIETWLAYGAEGLRLRPDLICFPAIAMVGAVPAAAMVVMLRRGAPLYPRATIALGALAAAALGNFGLRLFHTQDASLMVLVWQFGSVALMSALASRAGRRLINWQATVRKLGIPKTGGESTTYG